MAFHSFARANPPLFDHPRKASKRHFLLHFDVELPGDAAPVIRNRQHPSVVQNPIGLDHLGPYPAGQAAETGDHVVNKQIRGLLRQKKNQKVSKTIHHSMFSVQCSMFLLLLSPYLLPSTPLFL